jgi:hypothetical protein
MYDCPGMTFSVPKTENFKPMKKAIILAHHPIIRKAGPPDEVNRLDKTIGSARRLVKITKPTTVIRIRGQYWILDHIRLRCSSEYACY